jgi:hypothetical protein
VIEGREALVEGGQVLLGRQLLPARDLAHHGSGLLVADEVLQPLDRAFECVLVGHDAPSRDR